MTDTLTARLEIRCTPAQREAWQKVADADQRKLADWIRVTLGKAVKAVKDGSDERHEHPRR